MKNLVSLLVMLTVVMICNMSYAAYTYENDTILETLRATDEAHVDETCNQEMFDILTELDNLKLVKYKSKKGKIKYYKNKGTVYEVIIRENKYEKGADFDKDK